MATVVIEETPITDCSVKVRGSAEVLGTGPLRLRVRGGIMAAGDVVIRCEDIGGELTLTPAIVDEAPTIVLQLDIAHPHQNIRLAASFMLSLKDAERMLERMRHPLELARFEAEARQ